MQKENSRKEPIIIPVSDEELEVLKARLSKCMSENDEEELDEVGKIYPLRVEYLDALKMFHGIDYIIENEYNVYNAVKKYGMKWLEK